MKYTKPLTVLVPKQKRIEVYKEVLHIIQKTVDTNKPHGMFCMDSNSICLLLPCVLYEVEHFCNALPNGEPWFWENTKYAFPEIVPYLPNIIRADNKVDNHKKDRLRIKALTEIINNLTK